MGENEKNKNFLEKELFKLVRELTSLKTTVDISFKNFNETLSSLLNAMNSISDQVVENTDDIGKLKERVDKLLSEQENLKKEIEKEIEKIEKKLRGFVKKITINWKEVSKWAIIVSGILGSVAAIFTNLSKIKDFLHLIFRR